MTGNGVSTWRTKRDLMSPASQSWSSRISAAPIRPNLRWKSRSCRRRLRPRYASDICWVIIRLFSDPCFHTSFFARSCFSHNFLVFLCLEFCHRHQLHKCCCDHQTVAIFPTVFSAKLHTHIIQCKFGQNWTSSFSDMTVPNS